MLTSLGYEPPPINTLIDDDEKQLGRQVYKSDDPHRKENSVEAASGRERNNRNRRIAQEKVLLCG